MDGTGIKVVRHRSELGAWEMATRPAHPVLRAHLAGYCGYWEETPRPLRRREVPSGMVPLIISFGDPLRVGAPGDGGPGRRLTSFVAGLHDRPVVTEHAGRQHGVEVMLTPLGAYTLLGVPMRELANAMVDLDDLLGRGAQKLVVRLAEAPGWDERLALLDDALAVRLAAGREPSREVVHAWTRLCQTGGAVTVGGLASELGWSRRHLVERFREQVGLPPKVMARVLRFQRSLRLLKGEGVAAGAGAAGGDGSRDSGGVASGRSWAEVALACGYYDQAHLNRDFRAFAGCTPTEFLAARLPGDAGIAAA
jgi:AraC-like DNA-binding protein